MRILKWTVLAIIIAPVAFLAEAWLTGSAYMNRRPKVDVRSILPTGLRIKGGLYTQSLELAHYRGAGVASVDLANNLNLIISEMGLEYLNELRRVKGAGDGYREWAETPIDVTTLRRNATLEASIFASYEKLCAQRPESDYSSTSCKALKRALTAPGAFYTYGSGAFLVLEPQRRNLTIAYSGPRTRKR